jgi:hypothetical protein
MVRAAMLEQATLDVLARAAEIGLPEAAGVPASVYDPFLRPFIRKRVRRAIAGASEATTSARGDHVLKLAFLRAHPTPPQGLDANDARAVNEAFEKLAKPYLPENDAPKHATPQGAAYRVSAADRENGILDTPPRPKRKAWPFTFSLIAFVLLATIGVSAVAVAPYALPSPLQKFSNTAFGKAAAEPLTDAVVASGANGSATKRKQARAQIVTSKVQKQIGTAASADLERLLDTLPDAVRSRENNTDDALKPLMVHLNALNADLARQKVPALLHAYANGYIGRRSVWVTSFFVEDRSEVDVGGHAVKFVRGRRLDELNLTDSTIYKGALEDSAIVSLDLVDEEMVQTLLRPLAMETPMGPDEWAASDKSPEAELARVASAAIVSELRSYAKIDREDAITLHSAIARRNDAMVSLNKMGIDVVATSRIRLAPSLVRNLGRMNASSFETKLRDEVLRIDDRMKVYAKPLGPVVAEIARVHEEQFAGRFFEEPLVTADDANDTADRGDGTPAGTKAGEDDAANARPRLYGSNRSRSIAGAKLAFIARNERCPHVALWMTYRAIADDRVALGGAIEMMLYEIDPTLRGKGLDGADLAAAMKTAFEAPPARLREAAAKAYQTLMRRPPPAVTRKAL